MVAENEEEMRSMMGRLAEYLNNKNLELNAEKIVRFKKGDWRKGSGDGRKKG